MPRLTVRVTPRASADSVRVKAGAVHVRVTAPPVDGAANAAVAKLLAHALGLPSRDVILVAGATSREKVFEVPLSPEEAIGRLSQLPG